MSQPREAEAPQVAALVLDARALDDAALVRGILARDERAWAELLRRHAAPLHETVFEVIGDEAAVSDVLGDFWLKLVEEGLLRTFDPRRGASLLAWLAIRAHQVAHEHLRRRGAEPPTVPLEEVAHLPGAPPLQIPMRARSGGGV